MKKIISVFFCILLLLTNFLCVATAAEKITVHSTVEAATAGEALRVPVCISNNSGVMGFKLIFDYDSSVLTPVSVEYGEAVDYGLQDNIEGDSVPGKMCVYWSGTEDVIAEGTWFYINFEVNAQAKGETQIKVSYEQADTFNENFDDVIFDCLPVKLTIANESYAQGASFSLSADGFSAGESFKLKIKVEDITVSGTAAFTIPYNSQIFKYEGFRVNGVTASVAASGESLTVNVSGLDSDDSGKVFLELTFKSSENTVSGEYNFSSTALFNSEAAYCSSCSVSVKGGVMSGTVIYSDAFYALPGETVEIPVYASNNVGIMGFRLTFSYNSELLTPVSVTKGSALTVGTLNDSIEVSSGGSFDVLWNYTENFISNGELLLISFKVNEAAAFSTADIKVSYSETDTFNESYNDVALICKDIDGAITNLKPVTSQETKIKPTSQYIYSEMFACSDISEMLTVSNGKTLSGTPDSFGFYGTGSKATVKNSGEEIESYTIIIKGDINGDSVCDVLDAMLLQNAIYQNDDLTSTELEAVDFNESNDADTEDYQSIVNYMLSK